MSRHHVLFSCESATTSDNTLVLQYHCSSLHRHLLHLKWAKAGAVVAPLLGHSSVAAEKYCSLNQKIERHSSNTHLHQYQKAVFFFQ